MYVIFIYLWHKIYMICTYKIQIQTLELINTDCHPKPSQQLSNLPLCSCVWQQSELQFEGLKVQSHVRVSVPSFFLSPTYLNCFCFWSFLRKYVFSAASSGEWVMFSSQICRELCLAFPIHKIKSEFKSLVLETMDLLKYFDVHRFQICHILIV